MKESGKTKIIGGNTAAVLLVVAAFLCLPLSRSTDIAFFDKLLNFIRSFIYIGLFAAWGVSIYKRVMQPAVRKYLTYVSGLMVMWLVIRDFKWRFVTDPDMLRKLWYSYYIPMLLIPMFALLVSMHLGRTPEYRHPSKMNLLYVPTLVLIATVWTNDIHQKVFAFPKDALVYSEQEYSYGILYMVIAGWGALCAVLAFLIMLRRAWKAGLKDKLWLPVLPIAIAALNILSALLHIRLMSFIVRDTAVFYCLVFLGFFEACIGCGLIQTNSRYGELFSALKDMRAVICDDNYLPCFGDGENGIDADICRAAEKEKLMLSDGSLVRNMHIDGGHVIWAEDMSEILALREKLEETREELKERNELLKLEYERDKERRIIEEQNRLYSLLGNDTRKQIAGIEELTQQCLEEKDEKKRKDMIRLILLQGCYVKRRRDMLLTSYEAEEVQSEKLTNAFRESFLALKACGISGSFHVGEEKMTADTAEKIYRFFEEAAESLVFKAGYLNLAVSENKGIRVAVRTDMTEGSWAEALKQGFPETMVTTDEDGSLAVYYPEGRRWV